jgi:hypothetical protein
MIGIAMVRTGLVPSKIATFGIELDQPNRNALLFLLALVTIYFVAAFLIYAASDYIARREAVVAARERDAVRARAEEVAQALNTSEENVRRLYTQGELNDYTWREFYEDAPGSHEERDLKASEQTSQILAFFEERSSNPPPRLRSASPPQEHAAPSPLKKNMGGPDRIRLIALTRVFFEFFLPLLVGCYAIYALLSRALL